jgi:probable addiction module antidote protein
MKIAPFNPFEYVGTQEEIKDILRECLNDEDSTTFVAAVGFLIKHHGIVDIAQETGITIETLQKEFEDSTKTQWETIIKILDVLNIKLSIVN